MAGPAPSRLRARPLSSTSVSLQWTDVSLDGHHHHHHRGGGGGGGVHRSRIVDNRYYNIHYEAASPAPRAAAAGRTMSVIVKDLSVVLHDLEPATRYEFKVRTVKDGLTSPFSDVVAAWTLDQSQSRRSASIA